MHKCNYCAEKFFLRTSADKHFDKCLARKVQLAVDAEEARHRKLMAERSKAVPRDRGVIQPVTVRETTVHTEVVPDVDLVTGVMILDAVMDSTDSSPSYDSSPSCDTSSSYDSSPSYDSSSSYDSCSSDSSSSSGSDW